MKVESYEHSGWVIQLELLGKNGTVGLTGIERLKTVQIACTGLRITLLFPLSPDKLLLLHLLLKRIIIKSKKLLKICQRK